MGLSKMSNRRLLILFGSQTGTAQDVSERIWREAKHHYLSGPVQAMDDYPIPQLIQEELVVFVCSTTGQGEEPDNMKNFWKFLLRKNLPPDSLRKMKYAVLGLGDSSYTKFNYAAKKLNRRLLNLSATPIMSLGLADDQHDLGADAVIDPWISQLWECILKENPLPSGMSQASDQKISARWNISILDSKHIPNPPPIPKKLKSFPVTVSTNERITSPTHFQDVRLITFINVPSDTTYNPGDVLLVRPQNSPENVNLLIDILTGDGSERTNPKLSSETIFSITQNDPDMPVPEQLRSPQNLKNLATHYWDLNAVPRRFVLTLLSELTPNELEREKLQEMSSSEGQDDMYNYLNRPKRTILELLVDFPHAGSCIPYPLLFELFSPIRPRAFSIASSPKAHGGELHILVAVVQYKTKLVKPRLGLCSNWLASLKPNDSIHIWLQKGSLHFPSKPEIPIVMVGPGTGVAPFRSFICERHVENTASSKYLHLYFGCRNSNGDFHFANEWLSLQKSDKLTLHCAFSRDQEEKVYVQHIIAQNAEIMWNILKSNGHVFVAGNSKNMPKSVWEAIRDLAMAAGGLTKDSANDLLEQMEREGKYQTETWA